MANSKSKSTKASTSHSWRLCPLGEHWVTTHPMGTKKGVTTRQGHCARNPSHKDQLYFDEISEIKDQHFPKIKIGLPSDRGLMQITDQTQKILADSKGELTDHLINIPQNKMTDANANICAGIRWLFYKKTRASSKWKRDATWREAVAEYKAYTEALMKNKPATGMSVFDSFLTKLKVPKK